MYYTCSKLPQVTDSDTEELYLGKCHMKNVLQ